MRVSVTWRCLVSSAVHYCARISVRRGCEPSETGKHGKKQCAKWAQPSTGFKAHTLCPSSKLALKRHQEAPAQPAYPWSPGVLHHLTEPAVISPTDMSIVCGPGQPTSCNPSCSPSSTCTLRTSYAVQACMPARVVCVVFVPDWYMHPCACVHVCDTSCPCSYHSPRKVAQMKSAPAMLLMSLSERLTWPLNR